MREAFRLLNVWKRYGKTIALADASVTFGDGLNVIVGPNGSGKTTMLKLILGLVRPDSGEVLSLGYEPFRDRDRLLRLVGVAMEEMSLPWWTSGLELLKMFSSTRALEWSIVKELAEELGVSTYWHRSIRGYSMGMKKRLALLLGFATANEALILDEPFTQLDSASRRVVDELILRFSREMPVVISTHVMSKSALYADLVAVLSTGRVVNVAVRNNVGLRDFMCKRRGDAMQLLAKLASLGPIKHLELSSEEVFVSYEKDVADLGSLEELECKPSLFRALKYEEYFEKADYEKS